MTIIRYIILVTLSATLVATSLRGQDVVTEPTTGAQTSETAVPAESTSPSTQTSPDDRSLRAGSAPNAPVFDEARRIHFAAGVLGGYDDNVNLTPDGSPSWFANPTAAVSYTFGSSRLALTLQTGAGLTYYFDHPDGRDYDTNAFVQLSAAYKATPRLTLNFSTSTSYQSQPDFSTELSVNTRLGSFFRSADRLSASYQFTPRLSTVTSYALGALEYESSEGSLHDRLQHTFAEELRYLVFPTTTATAEYRLTLTDFANVPTDSTTHSFVTGVDQSFSPRFSASVRGGVQLRSTENAGNTTSPYGEGTIRYSLQPAGQTSSGSFISWTNRYSIEESDIPGGSSRQTFRTNLQLSYAITARVSGSLDLSYFHGDDEGSGSVLNPALLRSSSQDVFDIAPSLRYAVTRYLALSVGYRHSEVDRGLNRSTAGQLDAPSFSRNRYFAGVNITF